MTASIANTRRLCECGCKRPTPPAKRTDSRRGLIKGKPVRFLHGHRPGNRGPRPPDPDGPPCRPETLQGPACRGCRRRMHRQERSYRCRKGHVAHSTRGICHNCASRIRYGTPVELGPIGPRMTPDEILDEWDYLRGEVRWLFFHERVGLTFKGWERLFATAVERGDPRAIRHPKDEPVRHWRAVDPEDKEKAS